MRSNILDFNTAASQATHPDQSGGNGFDRGRIEKLRTELTAKAESVLIYLFPRGVVDGNYFLIGNVQGDPGDSMRIPLSPEKRGVWKDFAKPDKGGDFIKLWQTVKGISFNDALSQIETFLSSKNVRNAAASKADNTFGRQNPVNRKELGSQTGKWNYTDEHGNIIATVTRYDPEPGRKEFRPWDAKTRKHTFPNPRPLYHLHEVIKVNRVVLVEGEKCAEALIGLKICATTTMGGANAPIDKTDWSPLVGKEVIIWPDNDEPGKQYAVNAKNALTQIGCKVTILQIPEGKSPKWDAADAVAEGFNVIEYIANAVSETKQYRVRLLDWGVAAYSGDPPERTWLVDHVFPMGAASLVAAMGGSGKGMLGLHLALQVACDYEPDLLSPYPKAFGNDVLQRGTAVIFSAEDDQSEIHRRLAAIDASNRRSQAERLIVVPLPNAGGPMPLVVPGKNGPEVTDTFKEIQEQLLGIRDLKLVIFDPLVNFAMVDLHKDPAAGSFVNTQFAALASETGAAVLVMHHLNKLGIDKAIHTPEQAREKIKGTTTIVDGVRSAYCLWAMEKEKAKRVCTRLDTEWQREKVYSGAVVKSNGPADKDVKTYVRQPNGLLMVMDEVLRSTKISTAEIFDALINDVRRAAVVGRPFAIHGDNGFFERKDELSYELKEITKHRFPELCKELLEAKKIEKCAVAGSKALKWLDVPGGPFSQGIGEFEVGFRSISEEND